MNTLRLNGHRLGFVARFALMLAACAAVSPAWALSPVPYLGPAYDEEGTFTGLVQRTCTDYTLISTDSSSTLSLRDKPNGAANWYVVNRPGGGDVKVNAPIEVNGTNVHIIVCNNTKLHCDYMKVGKLEETLRRVSIYAQSQKSSEAGAIFAVKEEDEIAGIGGGKGGADAGVIEINGCRIEATGGKYAAGIGGGKNARCSTIVINGGFITARGGKYAAGIGGGYEKEGDAIVINGGEVTAWGGAKAAAIGGGDEGGCPAVTINGGIVQAFSKDGGAGIGTGRHGNLIIPGLFALSIVINGGQVTADAGDNSDDDEGAGIGGGLRCMVGGIVVNGGTVTAMGGQGGGAGIGAGLYACAAGVLITGGTVTATSRKHAAGIGGGGIARIPYAGSLGVGIAITGGKVVARANGPGAGIGGGDGRYSTGTVGGYALAVAISGDAEVDAIGGNEGGAGIGGGRHAFASLISISGSNTIVRARGGDKGGAGIGGGSYGNANMISVSGGNVWVWGGNGGAGIGGGREGVGEEISISDGHVVAFGGANGAGIGGGYSRAGSAIEISGGKVEATGGKSAAGIGGGNGGVGSDIKISGGDVTAVGHAEGNGCTSGAGIGGGYHRYGKNILIYDGKVKASADAGGAGIGSGGDAVGSTSNIVISGGEVVATGGKSAAGIGGGDGGSSAPCDQDILISGGTVTATGGPCAAGIGGGRVRMVKNIWISGGTVTATGGDLAAGFGGGMFGPVTDVRISGGTLTAQGGPYGAGIGGGYGGRAKNVFVSGGAVTGKGGSGAAGIGSGGSLVSSIDGLVISNGTVRAFGGKNGAGIGCGFQGVVRGLCIYGGDIVAAGTDKGGAGIGGGLNGTVEGLCVYGGLVSSTGGVSAAGIGSGYCGTVMKNFVIAGGQVRAIGGTDGAGIGSGLKGRVGNLVIEKGVVQATGGKNGAGIGSGGKDAKVDSLRIAGGEVTGQGGPSAAGIGSGYDSTVVEVVVANGFVRATGGEKGAGLGCGERGSLSYLDIGGGTVSATGGVHAAGIGGGFNGEVRDCQFLGGDVTAQGGPGGAGIGSGDGKRSHVATEFIFLRGHILATGGENAPGVGNLNEVKGNGYGVSGGTLIARAGAQCKSDFGWKNYHRIFIAGGSVSASKFYSWPGMNLAYGTPLCKVTIPNVTALPPVTVVGLPNDYGVKDLYPDEMGNLYFWLKQTKPSATNIVTVGTKKYRYVACGKETIARELSDLVPVTVNGKVYTNLVRTVDGCSFTNGVLTIYGGKRDYSILGYMTNSEFRVEVATNATVTLDNLWLESYAPSNSLIKVAKGCALTLKLKGANTLWANADRYALAAANSCCGVEVPEGASLKIDSAVAGDSVRTLFVVPSGGAAGIGGNYGMRNGSIEILDGAIGVQMGQEGADEFLCGAGAGIGAGATANNGPIAIRGGLVTVTRTETGMTYAQTGAGIGSGGVPANGAADGRTAGAIAVSGGVTLLAEAGNGAGVGSGARNARVDVNISPAAFVTATADRGAGIGAGAFAQGVSVAITNLTGEAADASVGCVETRASGHAAGIGSGELTGALTPGKIFFSIRIGGGRVLAYGLCETNSESAVAIGYGASTKLDAALSIGISDGTVSADSIGRNDGRTPFADVVITGGSVATMLVNGSERPQNAVGGDGNKIWPVAADGFWADGTSVVLDGGCDGYGKGALCAVNGKICLWWPDGEYAFTTSGDEEKTIYRWEAVVEGAPAKASREKTVIVTVDGEEIEWTDATTLPARPTTLTGTVTWSAKNLPKGLKIDSKTGVISGYPMMPGDYAVQVVAKSGSQSETFDLQIGVGNLTDTSLPLEDAYEIHAGVKTDLELGDSFAGAKATGLPAGLKFAAQDTEDRDFGEIDAGTVYGVASAGCTNSVRFTKKVGQITHTATAWFRVAAAPAWSVGTFNGTVGDNSGSATLTVAANGKISGKVTAEGKTWTFSSVGYDAVDEVEEADGEEMVEARTLVATAKSGSLTASVELVATAKGVSGTITGDDIEAAIKLGRDVRKNADITVRFEDFAGLYTVQLVSDDSGYGYLSLKLDAKGTCRATGKLPDGTSASATLPVVWDDEANAPVAVWYASPSAYKGGYVCGSLAWTRTPSASTAVAGDGIAWISHAPTASDEYGLGFERTLTAGGAYYDKLATLADYYDTLRFAADGPVLDATVENTYLDECTYETKTDIGLKEIDAVELACWSALTVSLDEKTGKSFVVDQKASKPVRNGETKEWTYAGENDAALTLSFTKATGIFRGSFTCWYDYISASDHTKTPVEETAVHTSKKVSYEGVMVLGESLRGFYLWNRTGTYEDETTGEEKAFRYKESRPVVFAIPE